MSELTDECARAAAAGADHPDTDLFTELARIHSELGAASSAALIALESDLSPDGLARHRELIRAGLLRVAALALNLGGKLDTEGLTIEPPAVERFEQPVGVADDYLPHTVS